MERYQMIPKAIARQMVDDSEISFDPATGELRWCDDFFGFGRKARFPVGVLFRNFLNGNVPMINSRIMSGYNGESSSAADLLKRTPIWKRWVVGDGRGRFWLKVPTDVLLKYQGHHVSESNQTSTSPNGYRSDNGQR